MTITVRYFASLRETVGRVEDHLDAGDIRTVADVWARLGVQADMPERVLIAVNHEYTDFEHPVKDGDEVALFPPVTGG